MKKLILIVSIIFLSSCDQSEFKVNYCVVEAIINERCLNFARAEDLVKTYKDCCYSLPTYKEFLRNK